MSRARLMTVIGAGPVGLLFSLLAYRQGYNVIIYEKRSKRDAFSRTYPLAIEDTTLLKIRNRIPELSVVSRMTIGAIQKSIHSLLPSNTVVFGKEWMRTKKRNMDTIVVHASGSKTNRYRHVVKETLGYILEIKYTALASMSKRNIIEKCSSVIGSGSTSGIFESASKQLGDGSGVSVSSFMNVDKKMGNRLPREAMSLLEFRETVAGDDVIAEIESYVRRAKERGANNDFRIRCIPLDTYQSSGISDDGEFYIGDAVSGVPYQLGLSKGWEEAMCLLDRIGGDKATEYAEDCQNIYTNHSAVARVRNGFLMYGLPLLLVVVILIAMLLFLRYWRNKRETLRQAR